MKIDNKNIVKVFTILVLSLILFRNTVSVLGGSLLANAALMLLIVLSPFCFVHSLSKNNAYLSFVLIVFFILVIFHVDNIFAGFIGYMNILGPFMFYCSIYAITNEKKEIYESLLKFFVIVGFINAVGACIQGYYSIDIFGMITNDVYANDERMSSGGVELRLISFISSPQSLAVYLAFVLSICIYSWPFKTSNYFRILCTSVVFIVGCLTISKAFFLYLLIFLMIVAIINGKVLYLSIIGLILAPALLTDKMDRIVKVFDYIRNIESYSAFKHWAEGFSGMDEISTLIFGKGLGYYSRGAQLLSGNDATVTVESYSIQIFSESGLLGFLTLFGVFIAALFKVYQKNNFLFCSIICFLINGLFSPAIYGYVVGSIFMFIVVSSWLVLDEQNINI